MNGNVKYLMFGVCVALLVLGASVGAASATTWYAEGDGAVAFNGYSNDVIRLSVVEWFAGAEEGEIRFTGTAIEYDGGMPGAPWGWAVSVDEMISGPQPCSNQLDVTTVAIFQAGYIDPDIVQGDEIEVYGYYSEDQSGRGVSLIGSENYYIEKITGQEEWSEDIRITNDSADSINPRIAVDSNNDIQYPLQKVW